MPDILIRGIEYPKSCADCEWIVQRFPGADYWCKRTNTIIHATWPSAKLNQKPDSCPIHELPPHGDLIDRDAYRREMMSWLDWCCKMWITPTEPEIWEKLMDALNDAPVIVPASEEVES